MRTEKCRPASWAIPLLATVAVCVLPASWMLSAFGYPCRSLISEEGLRWLCLHLLGLTATPLTACALLYASAVGAWEICARIYRQGGTRTALWTTALAALALCSLPLLALVLPDSPLRAITGGIWPSPLASGLPAIIALIMLAVAVLYGYLNLYFTSPGKFCLMLSWGLRRHAVWIVAAMLVSFIHGTLQYTTSFTI